MRRTAIALVLVALGACGGEGSPDGNPTVTPSGGRSVLDGDWSSSYTNETLRTAGVPEAELCEYSGTHQYTFLGSRWALLRTALPSCGPPKKGSASGSFTVSGSAVTFTERDPIAGCSADYIYRFRLQDGTLRFEGVQDDCVVRRIVLVTQSWRKTGA
jgi:hypothetical protein